MISIKKWLSAFVLTIGLQHAQAQNCNGFVLDELNNVPIANAVVTAGTLSAVTDAGGRFSLSAVPQDSLHVSHVGYQDVSVLVTSSTAMPITIYLASTNQLLNEVVVKAFYQDKPIREIPGSVALLTPRELKIDNQTTIANAINLIPGVLMQSGSLNTNRLTIRGIGARTPYGTTKIRAYYGDIPLTTGDGETTIEDIDIDVLGRVEVLKGPSSSIYGAGLGGTVLYQPAKERYGNTAYTELIVGSYGLLKSNTGLALHNEKSYVRAGFNLLKSDGYRENNSYNRKNFSLAAGTEMGNNGQLSILVNLIDLVAYIPSSIDSATFATNPTAAGGTWGKVKGNEDYTKGLVGISYEHRLSNQWQAKASLFSALREGNELRPFDGYDLLSEKAFSFGIRASADFRSTNKKWFVTLGTEVFNEQYSWQIFKKSQNNADSAIADNSEIRSYANFFAQAEYSITAKLSALVGANFNTTSYTLTDNYSADAEDQSGSYTYAPTLSPRFSLSYKLDPKRNVYALASHGFSPPSFAETLTPEGQINPDIQPETGWNYEIGFKGNLFGNFNANVAIFSMQISNLLVAERVGEDQFVGKNAGKTANNGLELNLNYVAQLKTVQLMPYANYTYANYTFVDFVDGANDYSGNELTGVPKNQFNVGAFVTSNLGFYGNIVYNFVGEMPMRDDNTKYSESYGVLNLKLGWQKNVKHFSVNIYAGINNILDEKYASLILVNAPSFGSNQPRYYYPGLPINYYAGARIAYNF